MNTGHSEIALGDEYDAALIARLEAVVIAQGGTFSELSWHVAGSQELIIYNIKLPSGELTATCETYMGLVLHGSTALVRKLFDAVQIT